MALFSPSPDNTTPDTTPAFFEQYKIIVESANKTTEMRDKTNNFYVSLNGVLLTITITSCISIDKSLVCHILLLPALGISICVLWYLAINNYKKLNSAKFNIIHEMEEHLPVALFKHEWDLLGKNGYKPLSTFEKILTVIYFFLHMVAIAFILIKAFS